MKLIDYIHHRRKLFGRKASARQYAKKLGITEGHLSRICRGKLTPSFKLLQRIVEVTEGEVRLEDFTQ